MTTFGGGERHLADLSHALVERGHDVYAASVPGSPLSEELLFLTEERILALSPRNYVKNLLALAEFIRAHNIEIVHAHAARDYHLAAQAVRLASRGQLVRRRRFVRDLPSLLVGTSVLGYDNHFDWVSEDSNVNGQPVPLYERFIWPDQCCYVGGVALVLTHDAHWESGG